MVHYIDSLGRSSLGVILYCLELFKMIYLSIKAAIVDQSQGLRAVFGVISAQIYFTAWQALPLVSILALASGGIVFLQSSFQATLLGGTSMVGNLMVVIIVRELGPLITALLVIARSGTAVASELGNMKANREIEALEAIGINPLSYIVFPRIVGGTISVLALAYWFSMIAIFGGYMVVRTVMDMPLSYYFDSIARALAYEDFFLFFIKNSVSGALIFVISCYQGLLVERSPHEVPQVTTKAVMNSIICVTLFNLVVSGLFYLGQLFKLGVL